jgi:hypothetical protein
MIRLFFLSLLLVSCGNPFSGGKGGETKIEGDFHPGAPTSPVTPPTDAGATIPANVGIDTGFKLGPGAVRAAGHATAMKAAITTTDRALVGPNLRAKISFSQRTVR